MVWIIPFNSYLVSGLTMLFFNFAAIKVFKLLSQSVCATANIYTVYEARQPLRPHRSRFAFFGGPTGPPAIANIFALLISAFAFLVVLLDFSINGATVTNETPTRYASLLRVLERPKPLHIDYAREFAPGKTEDDLRVSRRLVAMAEMHSCLIANVTHQSMIAYAFRTTTLDKTLIPIRTFLHEGECVSLPRFRTQQSLFTFQQTDWPRFKCPLNETSRFDIQMTGNGSMIHTASIIPDRATQCDLKFLAARCLPYKKAMHCGVVASVPQAKEPGLLVLYMANATAPKNHNFAWVRNVSGLSADELGRFAANVAFLRALKFPYGHFNTAHMALSDVTHNVTLVRRELRNVSMVNEWLAGPVLSLLGGSTVLLGVAALLLWERFVRKKNRGLYVNFTSVDEVLAMVREDGLVKSKEGDARDQAIFIADGRPVVMSVRYFEGMVPSTKKRVSGSGSEKSDFV